MPSFKLSLCLVVLVCCLVLADNWQNDDQHQGPKEIRNKRMVNGQSLRSVSRRVRDDDDDNIAIRASAVRNSSVALHLQLKALRSGVALTNDHELGQYVDIVWQLSKDTHASLKKHPNARLDVLVGKNFISSLATSMNRYAQDTTVKAKRALDSINDVVSKLSSILKFDIGLLGLPNYEQIKKHADYINRNPDGGYQAGGQDLAYELVQYYKNNVQNSLSQVGDKLAGRYVIDNLRQTQKLVENIVLVLNQTDHVLGPITRRV